ncbi:hypothetical protein I4U23_004607 [Adineta vaga]|nr:hypothetical protein I4U23_004607 [Adineta vaga]
MASSITQQVTKRLAKPKEQFSPSNPPGTTKYHLIVYDDNGLMMIVGNSSVKRFENDGSVLMNGGRTAKLITSGTKDMCINHWNKQTHSSKDNSNTEQIPNDDEDDDEEENTSADLMEQTLQIPTNSFSTPAPYRRQKTLARRPSSSDLTSVVVSSKRFAPNNRSNRSTNQRSHNSHATNHTDSRAGVAYPVLSSSDDEADADHDHAVSMKHILDELKNVQAYVRELYQGENLLEVAASNAAEYGRNLLRKLFTEHELETSLLPSQQTQRYSKPALDHERFNLLNKAIRHRYRIGKHHYNIFYKERIQESLAGCLYNEGTRKPRKKAMQQPSHDIPLPSPTPRKPPNTERLLNGHITDRNSVPDNTHKMLYWRLVFASAILLAIFLPSNIHAKAVQNELVQQLISEARELDLKIDESKIVTQSKGEEGEFAAVPLNTDSKLDVSRKQIENGEVYVAFQCMKTKTLSGCYRIRVTDAVEKKSLNTALVDRTGETIARAEVAPRGEDQVASRFIIFIWGPVDVYIDGVYCGTYDLVVITGG